MALASGALASMPAPSEGAAAQESCSATPAVAIPWFLLALAVPGLWLAALAMKARKLFGAARRSNPFGEPLSFTAKAALLTSGSELPDSGEACDEDTADA